jgi:cullin 3
MAQAFKEFYLGMHSGRQLTWQPNMVPSSLSLSLSLSLYLAGADRQRQGSADLKAFFSKKRCELNVSTFQMAILLLFNKSDALSIAEVRSLSLCLSLCVCLTSYRSGARQPFPTRTSSGTC